MDVTSLKKKTQNKKKLKQTPQQEGYLNVRDSHLKL